MSHVWVRITIMPIDVELISVEGGDETFHYTYKTEERIKAEEESAFGCYLCDVPMTAETYHQPCTGVTDEDLQAILHGSTDDTHDGDGRTG